MANAFRGKDAKPSEAAEFLFRTAEDIEDAQVSRTARMFDILRAVARPAKRRKKRRART